MLLSCHSSVYKALVVTCVNRSAVFVVMLYAIRNDTEVCFGTNKGVMETFVQATTKTPLSFLCELAANC